MPDSAVFALIGTTLVTLVGTWYWTRRQHLDRGSGTPDDAGAFCVWCLFRRGDACTHPGSPVYPGECGPVCDGVERCDARQIRW